MTILEIEAIEHLDFDADLSCENERGCDRKAVWRISRTCCDKTYLTCEECKASVILFMDQILESYGHISCDECGTDFLTRENIIFTPIA
jgi:hypothetical protein